MSGPDRIVLIYLRRLDEKVDRLPDEKVCLTGVEENRAGVHCHIDRMDVTINPIEGRFDLTDAPA